MKGQGETIISISIDFANMKKLKFANLLLARLMIADPNLQLRMGVCIRGYMGVHNSIKFLAKKKTFHLLDCSNVSPGSKI